MGKGPTINGVYYEEFGNFFGCKFVVDGITFTCTEQYYQYKKCENNPELQEQILCETSPKTMWKLGQKCKIPENWKNIKAKVMEEGNVHKFAQNNELQIKLVLTGNDEIIFNESGTNDYWDLTNKTILEKIRSSYTSQERYWSEVGFGFGFGSD